MDPTPTTNPLVPSIVAGLRYVLAIVGGWVIGKGWFTADQWLQVVGLAVGVVPLAFGVYSTIHAKKQLKAAIAAPADPPVSMAPIPNPPAANQGA